MPFIEESVIRALFNRQRFPLMVIIWSVKSVVAAFSKSQKYAGFGAMLPVSSALVVCTLEASAARVSRISFLIM